MLKHESILNTNIKFRDNWMEIKKIKGQPLRWIQRHWTADSPVSKSAVHCVSASLPKVASVNVCTGQDCLHHWQLRDEATLIWMLVDVINQQGDFTLEGFCANTHTDIHVHVYVFVSVWTYVYIKMDPRASTSLMACYSSSSWRWNMLNRPPSLPTGTVLDVSEVLNQPRVFPPWSGQGVCYCIEGLLPWKFRDRLF